MKYLITILVIFLSTSLYSQNVFFDYSPNLKEPTKIFYENGQLKEIGLLEGNKRIGNWLFYSKQGTKLDHWEFNAVGQKNGDWLVCDNNSQHRDKMCYHS